MKFSHSFLALISLTGSFNSFAQTAKPLWKTEPLVAESPEASPEEIEQEIPLSERRATENRVSFYGAGSNLFNLADKAVVKVITYRKPQDMDYEFTLLVVKDPITLVDHIQRAFIVSTAMPGKSAIRDIHQLSVEKIGGKPFPWITSHKYDNSPMYWGVNINGGYFIHSSPHYGNLGHPASMGCTRASIPDAMEVFDTIANKYPKSPAYSMIYEDTKIVDDTRTVIPEGVKVLNKVLADSGWTLDDLKAALKQSKKEISAVSKGDLYFAPGQSLEAHVRPFSNAADQTRTAFPACGLDKSGNPQDCWNLFPSEYINAKAPKIKVLSGYALTGIEPVVPSYKLAEPFEVTSPDSMQLASIFGNDFSSQNVKKIGAITFQLRGGDQGLQVRICDNATTKTCYKVRGPSASAAGEFIFPMDQVSGKLSAISNLTLEIVSGSGNVEAATVKFQL